MHLFWITIAIILAILEIFTVTFGFLLASVGALVAAALSYFGASWQVSTLVAVIVTLLLIGLLRPWLLMRLQSNTQMKSRVEELYGREGKVIEVASTQSYRVQVLGEDWSADCVKTLSLGDRVKVVGADGLTLKVEKINSN